MNAYGVGPFSPRSNSVIPVKSVAKYKRSEATAVSNLVPRTPRNVRVSSTSHRAVTVTWNPPTNARASSYQVWFYKQGKVLARVTTVYNGGVKLYGFASGRYAVRVRALNMVGESTLTRTQVVTIK
jgi:predicted phage tail protein